MKLEEAERKAGIEPLPGPMDVLNKQAEEIKDAALARIGIRDALPLYLRYQGKQLIALADAMERINNDTPISKTPDYSNVLDHLRKPE